MWLLSIVAAAFLGVKLRKKFLEKHELSMIEPLTGLANRRKVNEKKAEQIEISGRYCEEFSLLYFDLDDFAGVNARLGHVGADRCLSQLGGALITQRRLYDTVGRVGGDEFLIILPQTGLADAQRVAEEVRQTIETLGRTNDSGLTASIGVATFPEHCGADEVCDIESIADAAAIEAKTAGGNRVVIAKKSDG